ncbi:MAG: hypothetical protein CVU06_04070 [Bacteroidetes bacterium HGW-Bacteroidetes-22]|nr:MAG: hypothetical protein CVU06_04070 [Bacteroidetes bacterium HGW-Bacteroidetes-22]
MTLLSSFFYIPLCLFIGILYAGVLYYNDKKSDFSRHVLLIGASLRFVVVSLICFLLLSPMIRSTSTSEQKPLLIIAQDNSMSMVSGNDSVRIRQELPSAAKRLAGQLDKTYDVRYVNFGSVVNEGLNEQFNDQATDFSTLFANLKTRFENRSQSAVVLLTDGIINRGADPLFATSDVGFSIFAVGYGDTLSRRDTRIKQLLVNKVAFTGTSFPVEVVVNANGFKGEKLKVNLSVEGERKGEEVVVVTSSMFSKNVGFTVQTQKKGLLRIAAEVTPLGGETSTQNNRFETYVEVLDSRLRVLVLGAAPHPDLGALRQIIQSQYHLEVDVQTPPFNLPNPDAYNLIVYHQLPSVAFPMTDFINQAATAGVSSLFIVGALTNLTLFNNLLPPVSIQVDRTALSNAIPVVNPQFSLFVMPEQATSLYQGLPPFSAPLGSYKLSTGTDVLLYQKIDGIQTERPLVVFGRMKEARCGVITGEGFWRQRQSIWMQTGSPELYDVWLTKTIQYLAVRESKKRLRVSSPRTVQQFDPVVFDAELYNKSYEMINKPEVQLVIKDEHAQSLPYAFARHDKGYSLNVGRFPSGRYTWEATTTESGEQLKENGVFVVMPANLELQNLQADHRLLFNLARVRGGVFVPAAEIDSIAIQLLNEHKMKPVLLTEEHISEWISLASVFVLILLLLTGEWVLRRWAGSY